MTHDNAERAANIVIGLAAVAAACLVLTNPSLRRSASQLASMALRATGPWLIAETRNAWRRSAAANGRLEYSPDSAA